MTARKGVLALAAAVERSVALRRLDVGKHGFEEPVLAAFESARQGGQVEVLL